jgi:hypothetical protein
MARSNRSRRSRFENISDEEIQARWRALRPMGIKWLVICAVAAPSLFALHHYWQPSKQVADILSVAFRIAVGGAGLFAFLVLMSIVFARPKLNK